MSLHPFVGLGNFPETSSRAFLVELWIWLYSTEVDRRDILYKSPSVSLHTVMVHSISGSCGELTFGACTAFLNFWEAWQIEFITSNNITQLVNKKNASKFARTFFLFRYYFRTARVTFDWLQNVLYLCAKVRISSYIFSFFCSLNHLTAQGPITEFFFLEGKLPAVTLWAGLQSSVSALTRNSRTPFASNINRIRKFCTTVRCHNTQKTSGLRLPFDREVKISGSNLLSKKKKKKKKKSACRPLISIETIVACKCNAAAQCWLGPSPMRRKLYRFLFWAILGRGVRADLDC